MKFLLLLIAIYLPKVYAIECSWWQTKYSAAIVDKHPRKKTIVREHPRREYCRDKWKDAGVYIKQFKDIIPSSWPHKEELFKSWTKEETRVVLEILERLPDWGHKEKYQFHRAKNSVTKSNPATSDIKDGLIVLYDEFFKRPKKEVILVHEFGHHLYNNFSEDDKNEFAVKSGWHLNIDKNGQVFELPPEKLILEDSALNKEEDFTNH